ncbi:MAG: AgmX/PglI C-terminal domain-containing protein [Nannocystis sp.]|nr:AgmX/PglI C-terminal domain-containing protein [Nannocystis sp.]MBA3546860.1 AgmX/PglI C-terminal domain-containing protein [Nannocystis sp.]
MTTLRSMPSTSWTLLAVLAGALATSAAGCKKDAPTQPPDTTADDADADAGGGAAASDDDEPAAPEFLTVDVFEETMQGKNGEVGECFSKAREAKADLAGKLAYDFTIDGEGKISEVKEDPSSTIKDAGLNTCVRDKARGWSFPKTRDGKPMTLNYGFNLS